MTDETTPTTPPTPLKSTAPPVDAMKLAMELRRAVVPKTHDFNFKSYDRCVIGSDIVDWLVRIVFIYRPCYFTY